MPCPQYIAGSSIVYLESKSNLFDDVCPKNNNFKHLIQFSPYGHFSHI
jgi:hypothetical protein